MTLTPDPNPDPDPNPTLTLTTQGMNPMDLRRGINLAVEAVLVDLKSRTKMISSKEEICTPRRAPARPRQTPG